MVGINEHILLTGAGFTYDFGGFLAKDMWGMIFNDPHISGFPRLKELMRDDFDYESSYYKVISGTGFTTVEKDAFRMATEKAYKKLDESIRMYRHRKHRANSNVAFDFLGKFNGASNYKKGFYFTLNQDLFVERYASGGNGPVTPGVNKPSIGQDKELATAELVTLPDENKVKTETFQNPLNAIPFVYLKLHGSWNWLSSDGKKRLVIGRDKIQQISDEPLLKYYFELFEKALLRENVKLFVIGYGFGDEHINKTILKAIKSYGLKLYILDPSGPENFKERHRAMWDGVVGYFPYSISEVFGENSPNEKLKLINESYWGY